MKKFFLTSLHSGKQLLPSQRLDLPRMELLLVSLEVLQALQTVILASTLR
jgi:hypothetical protein